MNIFQDLFNLVKTEQKTKVLPLIATAVTNVASNPTEANVAAQGGLVLAQIIAKEIEIGQDALKELASDITTAANSAAASAVNAAADAATK